MRVPSSLSDLRSPCAECAFGSTCGMCMAYCHPSHPISSCESSTVLWSTTSPSTILVCLYLSLCTVFFSLSGDTTSQLLGGVSALEPMHTGFLCSGFRSPIGISLADHRHPFNLSALRQSPQQRSPVILRSPLPVPTGRVLLFQGGVFFSLGCSFPH